MSDKLSKEHKQEQLARVDNDMLLGSLGVVNDVLNFAEIDPQDEEPPPEWIEKYGEKEAKKKHRLALAGWYSSKNLPAGIKIATTIVTEVMKSRLQPQPDRGKPPLRKPKISKVEGATDVERFGEINVDE